MNKLLKKLCTLTLIISPVLPIICCSSSSESLDEQNDYTYSLEEIKNHLEAGIDASNLSVRDAYVKGLDYLSSYIKKQQSLVRVSLADRSQREEKLVFTDDSVIVKIEVMLGTQNILINAKLLNVNSELQMRLNELFNDLEGQTIDGSSLNSYQRYKDAFELIKKNSHIANDKYKFIISLSPDSENIKMSDANNVIPITFKIAEEEATKIVNITVSNVELSALDAALKYIKILDINKELTTQHKKERIIAYINKKLENLANDVKVTEIIDVNKKIVVDEEGNAKEKEEPLSGVKDNILTIMLQDGNNQTQTGKITLRNFQTFNPKMGWEQIIDIVEKNDIVFTLKVTHLDKFESKEEKNLADFKNLVNNAMENQIMKDNYDYAIHWELVAVTTSVFNTETPTKSGEIRKINVRWKLEGSRIISNEKEIKYIVIP
ncbi:MULTISPECIES: hypothetical protein [unclassified Spiroplasma]|uniref:hypothetical protein n=1 Tax=unclassified Spiroplasma TaxID=2637901 RepID=UPI00313C4215